MTKRQTLVQAITFANKLGFPYAVQEWKFEDGSVSDYVVAHGSGDGIGKTVYATIRQPGDVGYMSRYDTWTE